MAKRLIPLFDRVLVEKVAAPSKSVGGILLPEINSQGMLWWGRCGYQLPGTVSLLLCCHACSHTLLASVWLGCILVLLCLLCEAPAQIRCFSW